MGKKIIVEGAPEFMKSYSSMDPKTSRYKEIDGVLDLLKENPDLGDKIKRNLWPQSYVRRHGIHTLFRVD